jgi:hypothetical protein
MYHSAMDPRPEITLLATVAQELAEALERGDVPRPQRAVARTLLLRAWQATESDAPPSTTRDVADLTRRVDMMLVGAKPPPESMPRLRLSAPATMRVERDPPLVARVHARSHATDALVERTRLMVEKAVAAAAPVGRGRPAEARTEGARTRDDDLELVRGDAEPMSGARRRRLTGANRR